MSQAAAEPLPAPQVVSCAFPSHVQPTMPALRLNWPVSMQADRFWALPCGAHKAGPPPALFGIVIRRTATDRYTLRLIWDDTYLDWRQLRRHDLKGSCLGAIVAALGTSLDEMLDQPIAQPQPSSRYFPPSDQAA
jgi:hypothetical protein